MSIVTILLGLVAAFGVFLIFQGLSRPQPDLLESRLAQFADHEMTLDEIELSLPFVDRVLRPFFDRIGKAIAERTPANQRQALEAKIELAGRPYNLTVGSFLALQIIAMVVFALLAYLLAVLLSLSGAMTLLAPVAGGILGYVAPSIALDRRVKARKKEILLALPNALDLLTISVEAGLGFEQALDRTVAAVPGPLSDEFARMLGEVRAGASRPEAMRALDERIDVPEVRSFVLAILQADTFGVSIGRVLRAQADEMRIKRRQLAQEQAMKAPVKMLFPMVFCIFPSLFVVVIGPAVINISKNFK